jgi:NADP-dependent 3-hydroxy acid dehydrogenase YdfG
VQDFRYNAANFMKQTAVITGAGSGVGRAIAIALAKQNWSVALVGRREELLNETAKLTGHSPADLLVCACDIGRVEEVEKMARLVKAKFAHVDVLINAAGTNAPKRALEVLSFEDYHAMIDTNLNGAYYCLQAFLPQMRERKSGTIVNIVSDAGKTGESEGRPRVCHVKVRSRRTHSIHQRRRARQWDSCLCNFSR